MQNQFSFVDSQASEFDFVDMRDEYSEPSVGKAFSGPKFAEEWIDMIVGLVFGVYQPSQAYYFPSCKASMLVTSQSWLTLNGTFNKAFPTKGGDITLWAIGPIYFLFQSYISLRRCMGQIKFFDLMMMYYDELEAEE